MRVADDVILNKSEIIERCLNRVREIYSGDTARFRSDYLYQDATLLNLERACQAAIDLGMRWVRIESLGVPKESRDAFALLGFRKIVVHDYRTIDLDIVEAIIVRDFPEFRELIGLALSATGQ
jgi:uncharacterized protein YutE (UPF0331/DUF86 family)